MFVLFKEVRFMDPILLVWIGITVVIIAGALVIRKRNSQQD